MLLLLVVLLLLHFSAHYVLRSLLLCASLVASESNLAPMRTYVGCVETFLLGVTGGQPQHSTTAIPI